MNYFIVHRKLIMLYSNADEKYGLKYPTRWMIHSNWTSVSEALRTKEIHTINISNIPRLKLDVEDWKSKWRELRTYFIRESMRPPEDVRKNPAFNELYFLRPYVEDIIQARHRRSSHMSIYTMPSSLVDIIIALFYSIREILISTYIPELPRWPSA